METTTTIPRFRKIGGRIICYIPTVLDKLIPVIKVLKEAESSLKVNKTADNGKAYHHAKESFERVYMALIDSAPDDMSTYLWEKFHNTRNVHDRKNLKKEYNELAAKLNQQYHRKMYLLIH